MKKEKQSPNKQEEIVNAEKPASEEKLTVSGLFHLANRGMLLDIFVFFANLILMSRLSRLFLDTADDAGNGDFLSTFAMFLFVLALFILPAAGSIFKRWHYHQRLQSEGKTSSRPESFLGGCLFNPIFYFCLNCVIYSALNAFVMSFIYGKEEPEGSVFVSSILFGIVLMILQTFIVYRYFSPPKSAPKSDFLRDPRSEIVGDICIFLNMILYQILWNLAVGGWGKRPDSVSIAAEIGFRLFQLIFLSLFVYFPPRIFYLAEDIHRRRVWLTILIANLPVIFRAVYGAF